LRKFSISLRIARKHDRYVLRAIAHFLDQHFDGLFAKVLGIFALPRQCIRLIYEKYTTFGFFQDLLTLGAVCPMYSPMRCERSTSLTWPLLRSHRFVYLSETLDHGGLACTGIAYEYRMQIDGIGIIESAFFSDLDKVEVRMWSVVFFSSSRPTSSPSFMVYQSPVTPLALQG
jgi:hypothetical protein